MSTCTEPRTDRLATGRFVRNLALSLSGGALLTVAGAAVASADEVGTTSDGAGVTGTGDATAVGNSSGTSTKQGVAPSGGSSNPTVVTQTATVPNVGIAVANTGGNVAVGNASTNTNAATQNATGGAVVTSNSGAVANVSDGSAAIYTGDATAYGNQSTTAIDQQAHGALGILTNQNAFVLNAGVGLANTGLNGAVGNGSVNTAGLVQTAANTNGLANNSASSTNASNGSATIVTGAATATGNKSDTSIAQTGGGSGDGDPGGLLVITQSSLVANLGLGVANSGGNLAIGNVSTNTVGAAQTTTVDDVVAPLSIATNQAEVENSSDGTAKIHTGAATATGNDSATNLTQTSWGDPATFGAIVSTQAAGVANVGVGAANTGVNVAVGNVSENVAASTQNAAIGTGGGTVTSLLPVTASNSMSIGNSSDGTARIHTGNATATGNDSVTDLVQESRATVAAGGMGVLPNVQAAGVLNAGGAVANSGVNGAVGNASGTLQAQNTAALAQDATVGTGAGDVTALGPVTAFNSADVGNSSDGAAKVETGDATATGNWSETTLHQHLDTEIEGMGVIVAPQLGAVVNVGVGVANSGVNGAVGNASTNVAAGDTEASFDPAVDTTVIGPVTVGNTTSVTNDSDGEACVCTGDATASGNVSRSTLRQDLDVSVDDGFQVVPTTGLILNAGFGLANSGFNLAVGNISDNTAVLTQTAELDPGAPALLVGPQTIVNSGGAGNSSDGAAKVGSGNASATGNLSESTLDQAAVIGGTGVVAAIDGNIANAGLGLANSGVNVGVGNASTNVSVLAQTASGTGTVANQGEATNESDGTAIINYPCEDKVTPPAEQPEKPRQPGVPTLPRTGGAIETMAAVSLMLLMLGFGLKATSRRYAA